MSTLITRIAGYKFQIETHPTAGANGAFVAETGGFMALPYELRSTYHQSEGQMLPLMLAAHDAIVTLAERVEYEADVHGYYAEHDETNCATCHIADAINERQYYGRKGPMPKPEPEAYVDPTYYRRTGRKG